MSIILSNSAMPSLAQRFTTINISSLSLIKILIILGLVTFFYYIRDVLALLFAALVLSSALSPAVGVMERRGIPRGLGIISIYLLVLGIIASVIILLIPPIISEYRQLVLHFPEQSERFVERIQQVSPDIDLTGQLKHYMESLQSNAVEVAGGIFVKIFDVIRGLFTFFLIFVVAFYMIVEESSLKKALHSIVPHRFRAYVDSLISQIQKKIGLWFRGQLILSFIIFSLSFVSLSVLGLDYALILALTAGLTEFMPIIGPIVGAIPAVFIAFNQSPLMALWVAIIYYVIQYVENHVLVPRVMQQTIGINPLVSVVALLIGAKIGGILGIILAIPVATMIMVIANEFLHDDEGEEESTPTNITT